MEVIQVSPSRQLECISLILCDGIYVEPATGKASLLGMFELVHAESFPTSYPCLMVFAEVTAGQGDVDLKLKVTRLPADRLDVEEIGVFDAVYPLTFEDPRQVRQTVFNATAVKFPEPGEYRFTLETEGKFVAQRRLTAIQRES